MKKLLFILLLLPFLSEAQFSESVYQQLGPKTAHTKVQGVLTADSALGLPRYLNPYLPKNLSRSGYMVIDTAGGNYGPHYWKSGSGWIRLVDTTMLTFLSTIGQRLGIEDSRSAVNRTFSMANNGIKFDSMGLGTRFVSYPRTLQERGIHMVSTNLTDSAFIGVFGDLTTARRKVVMEANQGANRSYIRVQSGPTNDIQMNVVGYLAHESVIAMDSNAVQIYRRHGPGLQYPSALGLHEDSAVLWAGTNRESQSVWYANGAADQWATNRLAWRTLDSTGKIVITKNNIEIYAGPNEIELDNPTGITIEPYKSNLYIDSLQHTLTATAKMVTWDSLTKRIETRAIPSGGGSVALSSITDPTTTGLIAAANYNQAWNWGTLTSGAFDLTSTANTASLNSSYLLRLQRSGAHAASGVGSYSFFSQNTHSGTSSTNYAAYLDAANASTNYALYINRGSVNLSPLTASQFVSLDASKNLTSSAVASSILAASLSDETGTGVAMFGTSPTVTTSLVTGSTTFTLLAGADNITLGSTSAALKFGGTTSSFPSLVRNSADLSVLLADASAYTNIIAAGVKSGSTTFNLATTNANIINIGGANATKVNIAAGTSGGEIQLREPSAGGTSVVGFKAPSLAGDNIYTMPTAFPAGNGYLWTVSTAGVSTFTDPTTLSGWALTGTSTLTGNVAIAASTNTVSIGASSANIFLDPSGKKTKLGDYLEANDGTQFILDDTHSATVAYLRNAADNLNVGINTSTPTVAGLQIGDGTTGSKFMNFMPQSGNDGFIVAQRNGDNVFTIRKDDAFVLIDDVGNGYKVGIGVASPAESLDVSGNILASGTITPSDARYKKDINPIKNSLGLIMSLNPSTYQYDRSKFPKKNFNEGTQYGLLAQDVEKVIPEIVKTYPDSFKGINYSELIPILIGAIQEQQKQIDQLTKTVSRLTKK